MALYVDLEISLDGPAGRIELPKHRQAALAVQQLIEAALARDPSFRHDVEQRARTAVASGLRWLVVCLAPMLVYGIATTVLGSPRRAIDDFAHLVLFVPFVGLLAGLVALNHGWQQLRRVRRFGTDYPAN